jgi:hypothetical protein
VSAEVHLVTDGKSIYLEDQPGRVIDILRNAKQPMSLVCVTDQWRRFQSGVNRKPVTSATAPGAQQKRLG